MRIKEVTDNGIFMDDGTRISDYHDQDCCECVYAEFKAIKDQPIMDQEFDTIVIESVEDAGFRLNGTFVPCYNYQNGWYSSDLTIIVKYADGRKEEYPVSVEDHID